MADAVDYEAYALLTAAELLAELTEVNAEMSRQRLAGGQFNTPGRGGRSGVPYRDLLAQKLAIIKAMRVQTGGVIDITETDMSV